MACRHILNDFLRSFQAERWKREHFEFDRFRNREVEFSVMQAYRRIPRDARSRLKAGVKGRLREHGANGPLTWTGMIP
jgi:hypothetical protein